MSQGQPCQGWTSGTSLIAADSLLLLPLALRLFARLVERLDELAGLQLDRVQDYLLACLAKLLDVLVGDPAELNHQQAGICPIAVFVEADAADQRFQLVLAQIISERSLVEALDRLDRLLQDLSDRVVEWREIKTERIDLRFRRALGITREKILSRRETPSCAPVHRC